MAWSTSLLRGEEGGLPEGLVQDLDFAQGWFESRTLKTNRLMCATSAAGNSKALLFVCLLNVNIALNPLSVRTMAWSTSLSRGEEGGLPGGLVQDLDFVKG